MQSKSTYKVPNGKLLKIFLDYNEKNNEIYNLRITGEILSSKKIILSLLVWMQRV